MANLQVYDGAGEACPFLFFTDTLYFKIHHDGSHHVGTLCVPNNGLNKGHKHERWKIDEVFDELYLLGVQSGIKIRKKSKKMFDFVKPQMQDYYTAVDDFDEWLEKKIERKAHNFYVRERRFRRKGYLNKWNYFVTVTYDDTKFDGDELKFKRKLRRYLSNLHTRHGWKYMGVFERAPETGRLHFHGLVYVPPCEMVGSVSEVEDYSTKQHKMQITHSNSAFLKRFGRNDFQAISPLAVNRGQTLDYILKYIEKTYERVVYSRGIPTEIYKQLNRWQDVADEIAGVVTKYLLWDDVVDYERDVLRYKYKVQVTIDDLLANSRLVS